MSYTAPNIILIDWNVILDVCLRMQQEYNITYTHKKRMAIFQMLRIGNLSTRLARCDIFSILKYYKPEKGVQAILV